MLNDLMDRIGIENLLPASYQTPTKKRKPKIHSDNNNNNCENLDPATNVSTNAHKQIMNAIIDQCSKISITDENSSLNDCSNSNGFVPLFPFNFATKNMNKLLYDSSNYSFACANSNPHKSKTFEKNRSSVPKIQAFTQQVILEIKKRRRNIRANKQMPQIN